MPFLRAAWVSRYHWLKFDSVDDGYAVTFASPSQLLCWWCFTFSCCNLSVYLILVLGLTTISADSVACDLNCHWYWNPVAVWHQFQLILLRVNWSVTDIETQWLSDAWVPLQFIRRRKFLHWPRRSLFPLSWRGLNPVKLAYQYS